MREANTYRKIQELLIDKGQTRWLHQRSTERTRLTILVGLYLDPAERDNLVSCQINKNTLFLKVSSQSLATRLRFENRQLLKALKVHDEFKNTAKISFQIHRPGRRDISVRQKHTPLPRISVQTKKLLDETADVIEDEKLSNALRRLGKHALEKIS